MYRARVDVRWGHGNLCSVITSSEIGQSLVNPTVDDHGQEKQLRNWTECPDMLSKQKTLGTEVNGSETNTWQYFLEGFSRGQTWCKFFILERCPVCAHRAG